MAQKNEYTLSREFNAPRELVWKAFTESARLAQWWGPKEIEIVTNKMDFRIGGFFHYCMQSADGETIWGKFVYREIVAPERMVFLNSFADEQGNIIHHPMAPTWPLEMLHILTLTEQENKTKLRLTVTAFNASEEEEKTFMEGFASMDEGYEGTWRKLDTYLEKTQA